MICVWGFNVCFYCRYIVIFTRDICLRFDLFHNLECCCVCVECGCGVIIQKYSSGTFRIMLIERVSRLYERCPSGLCILILKLSLRRGPPSSVSGVQQEFHPARVSVATHARARAAARAPSRAAPLYYL